MYDKKGVKIHGIVFAEVGNLDHDEFWDDFIDFLESKNLEFGGGSQQIVEKDWKGEWGMFLIYNTIIILVIFTLIRLYLKYNKSNVFWIVMPVNIFTLMYLWFSHLIYIIMNNGFPPMNFGMDTLHLESLSCF